jgi:hypothetical protein
MKRMLSAGVLLLGLVPVAKAQSTPIQDPAPIPIYAVEGPTIMAFFRHVSDAEMNNGPDVNEALGDFQLYVSQAGPRLRALGVDLEVASATRFKLRMGNHVRDFRARKGDVGYYFIAPGKEPRIEYGVMTDSDLVGAASRYFGLESGGR